MKACADEGTIGLLSQRVDWGTIVITFDGCDSATATYESLLPEFGSGTQNLQRITTLASLSCN